MLNVYQSNVLKWNAIWGSNERMIELLLRWKSDRFIFIDDNFTIWKYYNYLFSCYDQYTGQYIYVFKCIVCRLTKSVSGDCKELKKKK